MQLAEQEKNLYFVPNESLFVKSPNENEEEEKESYQLQFLLTPHGFTIQTAGAKDDARMVNKVGEVAAGSLQFVTMAEFMNNSAW